MSTRLLILGAGPVGLECALLAVERGLAVTLVERDRVGANVRRWGHVTFFSPWSMNTSATGRAVLKRAGLSLPADDVFPTGATFAANYLVPLAQWLRSRCTILEDTAAVAIGRGGLLKGEEIGGGLRTTAPFRVLVRTVAGDESYLEADAVVDATGTYGQPNWLGAGGMPALGERALADRIAYVLPDPLGVDRATYAGRSTLVVGSGYSAITTLNLLLEVAAVAPGTQILWASRHLENPYDRIAGDPLLQRDALATLGNALAAGDRRVQFFGGTQVHALREVDGQVEVTLHNHLGEVQVVRVDHVVANVGYRPDVELHRELQVHQCYASEGTMKLAASLLSSSGESGGDCLAAPPPGPETLRNPEPGFFVVGSKSYGRNSDFLLRVGLEQVQHVVNMLAPAPD